MFMSKGKVIGDNSKKEIKKILEEIQDGTFIKRLNEEKQNNFSETNKYLNNLKDLDIEKLHSRLKEKNLK